jgi:aldehyde dehydrogenase (NAD+)
VAGIFTNEINRALRLATTIQAGQIDVNEYFAGGEETPFGILEISAYSSRCPLQAEYFLCY